MSYINSLKYILQVAKRKSWYLSVNGKKRKRKHKEIVLTIKKPPNKKQKVFFFNFETKQFPKRNKTKQPSIFGQWFQGSFGRWFEHSERTFQVIIHRHHTGTIIKFTTVIWCRKDRN